MNFIKWRKGSTFGEAKNFISHDIVDCGDKWIVAGLASDGKAYWFTRKMEFGKLTESDARLITGKTFPSDRSGSVRIFINKRNNNIEFSISTSQGIECYWIRPDELSGEPLILKEPSRFIQADFLMIFFDYLRTAWDEKYRLIHRQRIQNVLRRLRSEGINKLSFFSWLSSGNDDEHKHLNPKTPWEWEEIDGKRVWDFHTWQERYWFLLNDFIEICASCEIDPMPHSYMYGYTFYPFEDNNKQGINSFWSLEARKYQIRFTQKLLQTIIEKFSPEYRPYFTPMNEPRNRWKNASNAEQQEKRHKMAHTLAEWHRDIFYSVMDLTDLHHLLVDIHLAERPVSHLVTHTKKNKACKVCGKVWENWNNPAFNRHLLPVKHHVSVRQNVADAPGTFLYSWGHKKTSEDGGGYPYAKGYKITGTKFQIGTADQVYDLCKHIFTQAKKMGAEWYHGLFPMETFEKTPDERGLQQAYMVEKINWERIKKAVEAEKEVYKAHKQRRCGDERLS